MMFCQAERPRQSFLSVLAALLSSFFWLLFACSPFGGIYYLIVSYQLNILRLRNKTLQGGIQMLHYLETVDGWKLALIRYPAASGSALRNYPVLLIHGLSANRLAFDIPSGPSLARCLSSAGFDVWALEMRGSNLSFHPDYNHRPELHQWTFDEYVQKDVACAVEFLLKFTRAERVHCLGHSMGGLLSTSYISLSPTFAQRIQSNILIASSLCYQGSGSIYELLGLGYVVTKAMPRVAQMFIPNRLMAQLIAIIMGLGLDFSLLHCFQCNSKNVDDNVVHWLYRFGFHTIPVGLMMSLQSAIRNNCGICDAQEVPYLDRMRTMVTSGGRMPPTLLLGGTVDVQCPVAAVHHTAERLKQISPDTVQTMYLGRRYGHAQDYGHFDFLVGERAAEEVFPAIQKFLVDNDG